MSRRIGAPQCFVPSGRTHAVIYAVVVKDHPGVVKMGRTTKWKSRRQVYDSWNLADGDGVVSCAVYCVTEEYVDLAALERACLSAINRPKYRGNEWFRGTLRDAQEAIEAVLTQAGLSYLLLEGDPVGDIPTRQIDRVDA